MARPRRFGAPLNGAWHTVLARLALTAALAAACDASPSPVPTTTASSGEAPVPTTTASSGEAPVPTVEVQPIEGGPVLLRTDMTLRRVVGVGDGSVTLALNPVDGALYYLKPASGVYRLILSDSPLAELVASASNLQGYPASMTFGPDGTLYTVANSRVSETTTQAIVRRATPKEGGGYTWTTLATTVPYPTSNTNYDHLFNGITVSPDGQYVYVNAGSRTDHGEEEANGGAFPGLREAALTARIFRLPADALDLELPNDEAALEALDVVFATGTRNAFDLAFAPNGELFAVDNGPDADYPDELNWIRPGRHYGFPWRFGATDNPQQFADYDGQTDPYLQRGFSAVDNGLYRNDPSFPPPPGSFTDPVINLGPDAAQYRGDDGAQHDAAAEGSHLNTFTPHRSPLGLVFAAVSQLPADLQSPDGGLSAFVLSWGAAAGTLTDKGQDLLHLALTPADDNYQAVTRQLARGFKNPIDAVMIGNRLYILEYGQGGAVWEITFQ